MSSFPDASRPGVAAALLAAVLFGTAGTAQALGPPGTTPTGVGFARLLLGGLVLAALVHVSGGWQGERGRLWRRPAVWASAGCVALYQVAFFAGVERAGVGVGTLVTVGSAPVAAGVLAWVLLGRRPTPSWAVATAAGIAGVVLLSAPGAEGADGGGVLLALVAGTAIAGFSVFATKVMAGSGQRLPFLACCFLLAAGALAPLVVTQPFGWVLDPRGTLLALYLGVVTMAAANVAYARGLSALGPGPTSTLLLAEPVVALALAVLLLGEGLGPRTLAGAGLVVAALAVQGVAARAPRPARPAAGPDSRDSDPPAFPAPAVQSAGDGVPVR